MMRALGRRTTTVRLVLGAMLDGCRHGYDIAERTGLSSGTITPILHRLEDHGWVVSEREPTAAGRPRRRYYRLTDEAATVAATMRMPA